MIELICQQCGKSFSALPSEAKRGRKFCSPDCAATHRGISQRIIQELICQYCGKLFVVRPSIAKAGRQFCSLDCAYNFRKGKHLSSEHREHIAKGRLGKRHTEATKAKESITVKAKFSNPVNHPWYGKHLSEEHKRAISKANHGKRHTMEWGQRMSEIRQMLWQDPRYVAKVMASRCVKPTKPEKELGNILGAYFPQYKYNGDGSLGVTLAGMIPDFVNTNGKKEVIELFGDYYHCSKMTKGDWRRTELGRIMAYSSLGYRCLVIWEHELKELGEKGITMKIRNFHGRKHARTANP